MRHESIPLLQTWNPYGVHHGTGRVPMSTIWKPHPDPRRRTTMFGPNRLEPRRGSTFVAERVA